MDRFTRNYSIVLSSVLLIWLAWAWYEPPLVSALNKQLRQDQAIASFPYPFKVVRIEKGTAVVSTPRSFEFPVYRLLGILYPKLANRAQDDQDLMQAQQQLATVQKKVQEIVQSRPEVKKVIWELDKNWLARRGVQQLN